MVWWCQRMRVPGVSLKGAGDLQITVVGDMPVVLDAAAGKLFLPGGKRLQLEDARDAKLQQGGPAADFVAVSTPKALLKQPLDGSTAKTVTFDGEGVPAARCSWPGVCMRRGPGRTSMSGTASTMLMIRTLMCPRRVRRRRMFSG